MSSSFTQVSPAWLVQPTALANVFSNPYAPLKDLSSFVNVPDFTIFSSSIRQALYWRRCLSPSASNMTVIFSLLGEKGLCLPNILEVFQALKSVCDTTKVVELYRARNSSFIGISFNNHLEADKVRSHFSFFKDFMVVHVLPSSSLFHHFKLLGLPPLFPDSRIHHFLSKHSVHHHFSRDFVSTDINTSIPCNSVSGTMELASHDVLSGIPHLIPLPSPHLGSALLILSGRASLCLKCGATGHIRRSCSSPRCSQCHRFHSAVSECPSPSDSSSSSLVTPWFDMDSDLILDAPLSDSSPIVATECDRTPITSPALTKSAPIIISFPPSSIDIVSQENNHAQSTSVNHPPSSVSHESSGSPGSLIITKRITRSLSSAKRTFSSTSTSSASPDKIFHNNAFNALSDEVLSSSDDTISQTSTLPHSQPSDHLFNSATHKDPLHSLQVVNSQASDSASCSSATPSHFIDPHISILTSSGSDTSASLPSKKRAKTSDPPPSKSPPPDSDLPSPSKSWADQAAMELDHQDAPMPTTFSSASSILPLESSPDVSNIISSHAPSSANPASSDSNDESDPLIIAAKTLPRFPDKSLDPYLHLYIHGLPKNSSRQTALIFLDPIMPISLWHILGPNHAFVGNFGATFSSREDVNLVISRNGHLYNNANIFIAHFRSSDQVTQPLSSPSNAITILEK